jgi:tetratricopeptide (TPR) repeat protein
VKATLRCAVTAAGAIALAATSAPRVVVAQRSGQPAQDTPRILIATFHSTDPVQGVSLAEALRSRVQQETPIRLLYVLPRNDINNYLTSSGYKADSALSASDLKELARLMRADEILDGLAVKAGGGIRVDARLMLARDVALAQPLPTVEGKDAGAAARQLEKELSEARKQLVDNRRCENAIRAEKYDEAIAAARAGIQKYPNATLARLCLMTAYSSKKMADSVLRIAEEILKLDSISTFALRNAVASYQEKGDTAKAVQMSIRLSRLDPSVRQQIIQMLGALNKPDLALPLVKEMLNDNPGDPQLLRMRWLLLLSAKQWKDALAAGEEYVKTDTVAATSDYFTRAVATAAADSQLQLASQIAARAVQKFANNAELWMLYAQTLRKAGQLQQAVAAAQRAFEINPKVELGVQFIAVTYGEMNQPDSAIAFGRKAVAGGAEKSAVGTALMGFVAQAAKAAQEAGKTEGKGRDEWMHAYRMASTVDSIAPNEQTKYFIGVSAFQIGYDALSGLNKSKSCAEAQLAEDMWATSQINMPQGAKVDTQVAGQIMGAIQQYSPVIQQAKSSVCKPTKGKPKP